LQIFAPTLQRLISSNREKAAAKAVIWLVEQL